MFVVLLVVYVVWSVFVDGLVSARGMRVVLLVSCWWDW